MLRIVKRVLFPPHPPSLISFNPTSQGTGVVVLYVVGGRDRGLLSALSILNKVQVSGFFGEAMNI